MISPWVERIPLQHRFNILYVALGVVIAAAFFGVGYWGRHTYVTTVRTRTVQKSWGTPDSSIPAAQVSPQLAQAGLTVCDVYQAKRTVVCH